MGIANSGFFQQVRLHMNKCFVSIKSKELVIFHHPINLNELGIIYEKCRGALMHLNPNINFEKVFNVPPEIQTKTLLH